MSGSRRSRTEFSRILRLNHPVRLFLVGYGALGELYYRPAMEALANQGLLTLAGVIEPSPARLPVLKSHFPGVPHWADLRELPGQAADLAVVCTPQAFHREQVESLLKAGLHVLCEKPMASSLAEAESMVQTAREASKELWIGMFRRQFPSHRWVRELIESKSLGPLLELEWLEGGVFNWPAVSPSFFDPRKSPGGVWADLGSHVADLLGWWLGMPDVLEYEDDCMGGLECNCRVLMTFPGGEKARVRLSRDSRIPNRLSLRFERGEVLYKGSEATKVLVRLKGTEHYLDAALSDSPPWPGLSYSQSFTQQLEQACLASRSQPSHVVTGVDALNGIRMIEQGYQSRSRMQMPWMDAGRLS